MINIVSCTNRVDCNSLKIAKHYKSLLEAQGADNQLLNLQDLPREVAFSETYGNRSEAYTQRFVNAMEQADRYVFVIAEYNGGFPGILKLFIDTLPPKILHDKTAGLVGLSSGAAGALRAMDQFSNVLNYLKVDVISNKPKLSGVEALLDAEGNLVDERALTQLETHAHRMIALGSSVVEK